MNQLHFIFKNIQHTPDPSLEGRVLRSLRTEQERLVKRRGQLARASVAGSVILLSGTIFFLGTALLQSEFWSLFMLLFSDMGVVVMSAGDFFSSLLETLPIIPLIIFFVPLTLFFFSMSFLLSLGEREVLGGLKTVHS